MNRIIKKSDLIAARQHVTDSAQALEDHASRNLNGLSNEQMVDVELKSIDLAHRRDLALKEYQEMLHVYHYQEMQAAKTTATEDKRGNDGAAVKDTI